MATRPTAGQRLGAAGEQAAATWYEAAGYRVLARNWRCAAGEIDLVLAAPSAGGLVFCEVKTRSSAAFGTAAEAVTRTKQARLRRLAAAWMAATSGGPRSGAGVRFDVACVTPTRPGIGQLEVDVVHGAF